MRHWYDSQLNKGVVLYVDIEERPYADGMPHTEPPRLVGWVWRQTAAINKAYVLLGANNDTTELGPYASLWEAKGAVENRVKAKG